MKRKYYYIWLVKCLGAGNLRIWNILEAYSDVAEFYDDIKNQQVMDGIKLTLDELRSLYDTSLDDIEELLKPYDKFKPHIVTIEDELYPQQLRNIDNPPVVLFVVGDISHLEDELLLTVVGTRKESLYGRRACEIIVSELAVSGFSIVSGLANGGDTTAHITALKCGARSYGFLACGLDVDYPYNKAPLKNAIYKNGAIITEFLPGTRPLPENFHIRNRLLSGMSVGTLVIEAPKRSGTLITANCALNQGRDVFAVPAGIFWVNSLGTIDLIKNGAKPTKDALDIIEEYLYLYPEKIHIPTEKVNFKEIYETNRRLGLSNPNAPSAIGEEYKEAVKQTKKELRKIGKKAASGKRIANNQKDESQDKENDSLEKRIKESNLESNQNVMKIISLIGDKPLTTDEIADLSGLNASDVMVSISLLEIKHIVKKLPGNRIELIK